MVGTIRINLIVAAAAAVVTFALSIANNLLLTTCLKSLYSFVILFVLTFGFRWVLGLLVQFEQSKTVFPHDDAASSESHIGNNLDLSTPEDEAAGRPADPNELQFAPLNPPKLATKTNLDPEQLAGALRRMSED